MLRDGHKAKPLYIVQWVLKTLSASDSLLSPQAHSPRYLGKALIYSEFQGGYHSPNAVVQCPEAWHVRRARLQLHPLRLLQHGLLHLVALLPAPALGDGPLRGAQGLGRRLPQGHGPVHRLLLGPGAG